MKSGSSASTHSTSHSVSSDPATELQSSSRPSCTWHCGGDGTDGGQQDACATWSAGNTAGSTRHQARTSHPARTISGVMRRETPLEITCRVDQGRPCLGRYAKGGLVRGTPSQRSCMALPGHLSFGLARGCTDGAEVTSRQWGSGFSKTRQCWTGSPADSSSAMASSAMCLSSTFFAPRMTALLVTSTLLLASWILCVLQRPPALSVERGRTGAAERVPEAICPGHMPAMAALPCRRIQDSTATWILDSTDIPAACQGCHRRSGPLAWMWPQA